VRAADERRWRNNFRLLWLGQVLVTAGATVLVPLLPLHLERLGAAAGDNRLWTGLTLGAPALTLALAAPLWGRLGDRWGRKWMVVRALFGFGLALSLMAFAANPVQLLLCRLLQGACGGVVEGAAAFAGAEAPAGARGRTFGSLHTATAAGAVLGPLAGGIVSDLVGLPALLLAVGILTAGCAGAAALGLRETRARPAHPLPAPAWSESVAALVRHRRLRGFIFGGFLAQAGVYGLVTVFAPHVRGLLAEGAGVATWVGALQAATWGATIFGGLWWGRRHDREPVDRSFVWAALGCGLSIAAQAWPDQPGWLFPLRAVQGFCFAAIVPAIYLEVSRAAAVTDQGVRMGLANSILTVGQIVGALAGALLSSLIATGWVFAILGGCFGVAAARVHRSSATRSQP
jgi:MFS transporter, DHA1 family, staphyloferrin B biosynthesis exporter